MAAAAAAEGWRHCPARPVMVVERKVGAGAVGRLGARAWLVRHNQVGFGPHLQRMNESGADVGVCERCGGKVTRDAIRLGRKQKNNKKK